jgi:hypothetical protein
MTTMPPATFIQYWENSPWGWRLEYSGWPKEAWKLSGSTVTKSLQHRFQSTSRISASGYSGT